MRRIRLKWAARCRSCGNELAVGTGVWWEATQKVIVCLPCGGSSAAPDDVGAFLARSSRQAAGTSAHREYERRSRRSDAVGSEPQHVVAWKLGAHGEAFVANVLQPIRGIEVLHDRLAPGGGNIDHLVIGPAGVFVVDAKNYKSGSLVETRTVGRRRLAQSRLYVGGRDRTSLVDGVLSQVRQVRSSLPVGFSAVPVWGVLCFVGAAWGHPPRPSRVSDVLAVWPEALPGLVTTEGHYAMTVERVAGHLRMALPAATR